jgi:hypothetical protein
VAALQAGAWIGQLPFWRQPTQTPITALQSSDGPHCDVLLEEHWPQPPPGWHAGLPAWPAQPLSLVHATQV